MKDNPSSFKEPVIILANGPYPTHPVPLDVLHKAQTVICTDGSADQLLAAGIIPRVIIGDMDSINTNRHDFEGLWIPAEDQSRTDLEKGLDWCVKNHIRRVTLLGAIGRRDDHSLVNLILMTKFAGQIIITIITDYSTIDCLKGEFTFDSFKGQIVSIIPTEPIKSLSTINLEFPLNQEPLLPSGRGVSNVARGESFTISASGLVWVVRSHK